MKSDIIYKLATATWDEKEYDAIFEIIKNGIFTMGDYVKKCEQQFSMYMGTKYSVMVNSGSSANLLMVAALEYRKNKKDKRDKLVIVPAVSWATTYYPFHQYGYRMKFVDVDINTLNYDIEQLEYAIKEETPDVIICVNILGNSNDFDSIKSMISEDETIILEDNCESLGADYKNKKCGTIGLMGTYSTFFSHHISTMEGGFITTDNEELYHILLSLRAHGWTRNLPDINHVSGKKSDNWFEESYKFVLPGYNVRPLEMSGAIGIKQIEKLPVLIEQRRKNAEYFLSRISEIEYIKPQKETPNSRSSWFGFSLILDDNFFRKKLIDLFDKNGIESRPIVAGNFYRNPVIKHMHCQKYGILKNADIIHEQGLFVGNHHYNIKNEIDHLIETIKKLK